MAVRREARILPDVARIVTCQAMEILTAYILGIMVHQATDVGKIAIYEETAGREHYGDEKKNPCWSM